MRNMPTTARGRISVKDAAEILNVSQQFVRLGLQWKILPIGHAIKMSSTYSYHISPKLLAEYVGDLAMTGESPSLLPKQDIT